MRRYLFLLMVLYFSSCYQQEKIEFNHYLTNNVSSFDASTIIKWSSILKDIDQKSKDHSIVTNRSLAYIYLGAYEALVPGMEGYKSYHEHIEGLLLPESQYPNHDLNWNLVINAYFAQMIRQSFTLTTVQLEEIDQMEYALDVTWRSRTFQDVATRSVAWGKQLASAMMLYKNSDINAFAQVNNPSPIGYVLPQIEGRWRPTAPKFREAIYPYWGLTRTFVLIPSTITVAPPHTYSSALTSAYGEMQKQTYNQSYPVNDTQKQALYWSSELPGNTNSIVGHMLSLAIEVIRKNEMKMDAAIHMLCVLHMVNADAGVLCFDAKYKNIIERPETYIKKYIDPQYENAIAVNDGTSEPNYPGYPSYHALIASSSTSIFRHFVGENYEINDDTHSSQSTIDTSRRSFVGWEQINEQVANSRLLLGLNTLQDVQEGQRLGNVIARNCLHKYSVK